MLARSDTSPHSDSDFSRPLHETVIDYQRFHARSAAATAAGEIWHDGT